MSKEVAVLGAGMHPWGKWGRNFVEYGVKAANDALKDAGIEWKDVQLVVGGERGDLEDAVLVGLETGHLEVHPDQHPRMVAMASGPARPSPRVGP